MQISVRTEGDICVVAVLDSRIDAAVALAFKERLRHVAGAGVRQVLLDLRHVEFLDSSGLGAVVAAMKHLAPDRQLVLAGLTPSVARVFQLTRMDRVFTIFPSSEEALADVRA